MYRGDMNIRRIKCQHKNDTNQVPDGSIDFMLFTLPHQESELLFIEFLESWIS
jgi:hypothetical protein